MEGISRYCASSARFIRIQGLLYLGICILKTWNGDILKIPLFFSPSLILRTNCDSFLKGPLNLRGFGIRIFRPETGNFLSYVVSF